MACGSQAKKRKRRRRGMIIAAAIVSALLAAAYFIFGRGEDEYFTLSNSKPHNYICN